MLAVLNFLKIVNFTNQIAYRPEIKLQLPVNIKATVKCHSLVVFQSNVTQSIAILYSLH